MEKEKSSAQSSSWISTLDELTKWIVSATTFTIAVTCSSLEYVSVPYYILGAICTALGGKCLKRLFRQERPESPATYTRKRTDTGMPSSHATSVSFLALAGCIGLLRMRHDASFSHFEELIKNREDAPLSFFFFSSFDYYYVQLFFQVSFSLIQHIFQTPSCWGLECLAFFVIILRVVNGQHTWPQVVVGYIYGTLMCLICFFVETEVLHLRDGPSSSSSLLKTSMFASAVLVACGFSVYYLPKWWKKLKTGKEE